MKALATTKEEIKSKYLDVISAKLLDKEGKPETWYSQETHKVSVGCWVLDCLEIKDKEKRAEFLKLWDATPGSFGTNNSALSQALGRPKGEKNAKIERTFSGF